MCERSESWFSFYFSSSCNLIESERLFTWKGKHCRCCDMSGSVASVSFQTYNLLPSLLTVMSLQRFVPNYFTLKHFSRDTKNTRLIVRAFATRLNWIFTTVCCHLKGGNFNGSSARQNTLSSEATGAPEKEIEFPLPLFSVTTKAFNVINDNILSSDNFKLAKCGDVFNTIDRWSGTFAHKLCLCI